MGYLDSPYFEGRPNPSHRVKSRPSRPQWRREGLYCFGSTTSGRLHAPTSTLSFPADYWSANQTSGLVFPDNEMFDISPLRALDGTKLAISLSSTEQDQRSSKMRTRL